jgi:hypothetical protein
MLHLPILLAFIRLPYGPLFFLYSGLGSLSAACLGVVLGRALSYLFVWRDVISPSFIPNQLEVCSDLDFSRLIFV